MKDRLRDLKKGIKTPFESLRSGFITLLISLISLILISLSSSINYTAQMFSYGFEYWLPAVQTRLLGLYIEGGYYSLLTSITYALLIGITIYNFSVKLKTGGVKLRNLSGIGPGFVAAGCAGCGVGLMSLLGLAGILAALPFHGESIRIAGILLLTYYLIQTGDPRTCSISS